MLASGDWSTSPVAEQLEAEFAAYHGVRFALSTNNGTAALHAAFFALGLGPGDEVISPSATYWATAMPVLSCGAIPVFADVDPETLCLDPADVERRLTPRTRAVVVMHSGGMPCDMDALLDIARRHRLKLVEDASHAHGATYRGRKVGTFGDVAAFSLQTSKLCPAGEGGVLLTDDAAVFRRATALGHYERLGRKVDPREDPDPRPAGGRVRPLPAHLLRLQVPHQPPQRRPGARLPGQARRPQRAGATRASPTC